MKIFIILCLSLTLFSCKKANSPKGDGKAEALMNGEKFEAVVHANFIGDTKDTIFIRIVSYDRQGSARYSLLFNKIPYHKDVFDLNNNSTISCRLGILDDDAILGDYYLDTFKNNRLEVKDIKYDKGKVEGTFEATMKEDINSKSTVHDFNFPMYFHFTEGKFSFFIDE